MSCLEDFRKWKACCWSERRLLLQSLYWLGFFYLAIRCVTFRRLLGLLDLVRVQRVSDSPLPAAPEAVGIGRAVRAVGARTPWRSTCLIQALAGMALLHRFGLSGVMYLGVAKSGDPSEPLQAHAWLQSGDRILTGENGHRKYQVVSCFARKDSCYDPR